MINVFNTHLMLPTVENINTKITRKIASTQRALSIIGELADTLRAVPARSGKRHAETVALVESIRVNLTIDALTDLETEYRLATMRVYYFGADGNSSEPFDRSKEYFRVLTGDNFAARFNDLTLTARTYAHTIVEILGRSFLARVDAKPMLARANEALAACTSALNLDIILPPERENYDICKCGERMMVMPELSELHCGGCARVQTIVGAVFRDDQYYPQDGQKTKHAGYEPAKHYRLWIERLQAMENKTFEADVITSINYVLNRDRYERRTLTCEKMRAILKDPKVAATHLNDHAPLLVKRFGGPAPPVISFHENQLLFVRFSRLMALYDVARPGPGNKRYYPYFIYKIIEHEFRANPEKLRLLESIHLQSRDTVIKNDIIFKDMCALANPADGLVYRPTDPSKAGR